MVERIDAPSKRKKLLRYFQERVDEKEIIGAAIAELVISAESGLIVFELHERERPLVRAIALTDNWKYKPLRYHLEDPSVFPEANA